MRRTLAKLKKTLKRIFIGTAILGALFAAFITFRLITLIPNEAYFWIIPIVSFGLLFWLTSGLKGPEKYINERGYVVLVKENELEHRFIAKQLLGRELARNEAQRKSQKICSQSTCFWWHVDRAVAFPDAI